MSIAAVILAAGMSKRMGCPKLVLPWGGVTVIEQVVQTLLQTDLSDIVVVTGSAREQVEANLAEQPVRLLHNPCYEQEEMALSLQVGLAGLAEEIEAALVVLGDQPQMQAGVVKAVIQAYQVSRTCLVIPSYQMRRGHPWLVGRPLWPAVMALQPPNTLRQLVNLHADQICYVPVNTPSILFDLDTPEEYVRQRP